MQKRLYDSMLSHHLAKYRQMAFVAGPRQVGKTYSCSRVADVYLNFDDPQVRVAVARGFDALDGLIAKSSKGGTPGKKTIVVLDELHKYRKWKTFLKGFFDTHESKHQLIVTGSARLDVYRRGGDSMMGRYFLYHMHPFSVAELIHADLVEKPWRAPAQVPEKLFAKLWQRGGFPEPLLHASTTFVGLWRQRRLRLLIDEDIRDLTKIQEMAHLELLLETLAGRSATQVSYQGLAEDAGVAMDTVKNWIATLSSLHYGFLLRPWFKRLSRTLRKEPKWHLRDWSGIADEGQRFETFLACHLLKAVEGWTDLGLGNFELRYLRDTEKREVDLVVVRDGKPWLLVEAKTSPGDLNPALAYFQQLTGAEHALQVVLNMPFKEVDCFSLKGPAQVSARTFLSQLL